MLPRAKTIGRAHTTIALACAASLTGCFPLLEKYPRIEAPGAVYFKAICYGGFGPPSTAYYPFHGIFISVNLESARLGLHVPPGMTAELNGDSIHVLGSTPTGPYDRVVHIKAFPHGAAGNGEPREFARMSWSLYLGIDAQNPGRLTSLPPDLLRGTIELPAMTINGQTFGPQILHFARKTWGGLMPVNC